MPTGYEQFMPSGPMTGFTGRGGEGATFAPPLQASTGAQRNVGTLYTQQTGGFGLMPASASPLSQAMQGDVSAGRWQRSGLAGPGTDPGLNIGEQYASQANIGYQQQQQEFMRRMQEQQMQTGALKNQVIQKLLGLFGGGAGGYTPGMNISGPVSADPKILAALQSKVTEQFDRPGGLQSQLQRVGAVQNRYSADSTLAAARQASLDRARAGAMTEAYLPAMQSTVSAYGPALELERIKASQAGNMPQLLASIAGKVL